MVRVKICGITNLQDALDSIDAGAEALGFVFYKKSPRYISPERASTIIKNLPRRIIKIGVFVNSREKRIRKIAKLCRLTMLQFHGDESPGFCQRFSSYKVIKAFRVKNRIDFKKILRYKTSSYLFDTYLPSQAGGTGKKFNWLLLTGIDKIKRPIFLSGGLTAKNVLVAIKKVRPAWVDVSSSIEIEPGKKDKKKIKEFISAAKKAK